MKRCAWLLASILSFGLSAAADTGYLRLSCPAGAEIFVDGVRAGVCAAANEGTSLSGLSAGQHILRIEQDGFLPRELPVVVGLTPQQVVFGELVPAAAIGPQAGLDAAQGAAAVGTIELSSEPVDCSLRIGRRWIDKKEPLVTILDVPVGEHDLRFERFGVLLKASVEVASEVPTRIRANFTTEQVEMLADEAVENAEEPPQAIAAPASTSDCVEYWVQILRTDDLAKIEVTQKALDEIGFPPRDQKLITVEDDGVLPLYKLRIGPLRDRYTAKLVIHKTQPLGIPGPLVLVEPCGQQQPASAKR